MTNTKAFNVLFLCSIGLPVATARIGSPKPFDYAEVTKVTSRHKSDSACAVLSLYLDQSLENEPEQQIMPQKTVYFATKGCKADIVFDDSPEHSISHSNDKRASTEKSHVHIMGSEKTLECFVKKVGRKFPLPISYAEIIRQTRDACKEPSLIEL